MKRLRTFTFSALAATVAVMAIISIGVHFGWTPEAYSSIPMLLLWGSTAISALVYIFLKHLGRQPLTLMLHLAFILILIGALVTHFCSVCGTATLKQGATVAKFVDDKGDVRELPFTLTADSLSMECYPGTSTPMDFHAVLRAGGEPVRVSLNHAGSYAGYRFFLKSLNPGESEAMLSVQRDTVGTIISYIGYILLVLSMLLFLLGRDYGFRKALRKLSAAAVILLFSAAPVSAEETKDASFARYMAKMYVFADDRIMPISTLAEDFFTQLTGSSTIDDNDAMEVMAGFIFRFSRWKECPVILLKSAEMKRMLGRPDGRASYVDFFNAVTAGRLDTDHPELMTEKQREDVARFESVNMLVTGSLLRIFPVNTADGVVWLSPTDNISVELPQEKWLFIRKTMGYVNELVQTGRYGDASDIIDKIVSYQKDEAGEEAFPSPFARSVEQTYVRWFRNCFPEAGVLTAAGLLLLVLLLAGKRVRPAVIVTGWVGWLYLTASLAMRWIVSGHIPMGDGFETMQFMAWLSLGTALVAGFGKRPVAVLLAAAAVLTGGLCLLVSAMNGGRGNIIPLMPVLSSPWLSIHVALVMLAYTLFALMAVMAICGLVCRSMMTRMADVCRVMLYPGVFLLAAGIFVGAVWANQSWGRYWGWDPKEVWALITMLIYCYPLHVGSLSCFRRDKTLLIYMVTAFVSVLFTYFGVNYLLGGLHSYA